MRRAGSLLVLGVVAAALGAGSARADGGTTTTATTPDTTTAAPTPSYSPLPYSSLSSGCAGAGAAALVLPTQRVIALGLPASGLGPSAYPSSGTVLTFDSSASSGATCTSAGVTLSSVSLFGGAVTASSVQATGGKGTATGLEVDGTAVAATPGATVPVEGWGQLTLGATVGRVTAPLVLRLLQAHGPLPAGTVVALAFAASALPVAKPQAHQQAAGARGSSAGPQRAKTQRRPQRPGTKAPARARRPADLFWSHYGFADGGEVPPAAQHNPVVSTAMQYLGVPYVWGGARPKTGFDCSGLVQYVFARLGVSLPHWTVAQWHSPETVWVAPSRLQPGDLVFFIGSDGTRRAPGHVGIYVGDGELIDAPQTGSSVRVDSFSDPWFAHKYVGAKRVVASFAARPLRGPEADASTAALRFGFPQPFAGGPIGESPAVAATVPTAARTSALRDWTGVGIGGLLLLLVPGAFGYRRRRRTQRPEPTGSAPLPPGRLRYLGLRMLNRFGRLAAARSSSELGGSVNAAGEAGSSGSGSSLSAAAGAGSCSSGSGSGSGSGSAASG